MGDKKKLKPKPTANPNNKGQPFFSPSFMKKRTEGQFSLMASGVPAPVVTRTDMGIIATVYFEKNSYFLNTQNFDAVQKLSEDLKYLYNPKVIVDGHTSEEGSEQHNLKLSENRRSSVIALLNTTEKPSPINYEGQAYGESQPEKLEKGKTSAEKEDQRKFNRRVEIKILYDPSTIKKKKEEEEEKKKPIDIRYRPTPEDIKRWEEEEFNRRLWQTPYTPPYKKQSLNDLLWKKFDDSVDRALKKMGIPEKLRPLIRKGARKAIEKGAETILDNALDQTGLGDAEKKAIKKVIEATGNAELFPK